MLGFTLESHVVKRPILGLDLLIAQDTDVADEFGSAVAIEGDVAIVGARHSSLRQLMAPEPRSTGAGCSQRRRTDLITASGSSHSKASHQSRNSIGSRRR